MHADGAGAAAARERPLVRSLTGTALGAGPLLTADARASLRLLIVQPWLAAPGHPAQSTLNTARALGRRRDIGYLLISSPASEAIGRIATQIAEFGPTWRARINRASLSLGTLRALTRLAALRRRGICSTRTLFLDGHLLTLGLLWGLFRSVSPSSALALLVPEGPERYARTVWRRLLVRRLLARSDVSLFLRTDELAAAWREAFGLTSRARIGTLPTLELVGTAPLPVRSDRAGAARFAVIGQVRPGKGLDWLIPTFCSHRDLGTLLVAGSLSTENVRTSMPELRGYPHFIERFLPEQELLDLAIEQDWLLTLYDEWDTRMEAATLFLAARAGCPVVAYDEGWCGRVVRTFGNGVLVPRTQRPGPDFFRSLPTRSSAAYREPRSRRASFSSQPWRPRYRAALSRLPWDSTPLLLMLAAGVVTQAKYELDESVIGMLLAWLQHQSRGLGTSSAWRHQRDERARRA